MNKERYRPCLVNDEKALFHMWFEDSLITLKFNTYLSREDQNTIYKSWETYKTLPMGVEQKTDKIIRGLVEMEDGTMCSISPNNIRFLDTDYYIQEQGAAFSNEWIEYIKGIKKNEK